MALWSVWICLRICCICLCVCTLCVHVYICSPYNFQIILHLLMKPGINVMTLRFILLFYFSFMSSILWTWQLFRVKGSEQHECHSIHNHALTNLRKYATVITVIFISRMKNKNILSDWQETWNSPESLHFLLLNHKMDYTKNRNMLNG